MSPVDVAVKVRVMRSVLRLVGDRTLESDLRPICGGGRAEAEEWTLVDRCRRLFAVVQSDTSKGMSAAHYVRFCKNAGLLELGSLRGTWCLHTRLCVLLHFRATNRHRHAGRRSCAPKTIPHRPSRRPTSRSCTRLPQECGRRAAGVGRRRRATPIATRFLDAGGPSGGPTRLQPSRLTRF